MSELKAFTFGLGQYTEDGSPCVVAFDVEKNPRLASDEKFYLKSEADKVISELEKRLAVAQQAPQLTESKSKAKKCRYCQVHHREGYQRGADFGDGKDSFWLFNGGRIWAKREVWDFCLTSIKLNYCPMCGRKLSEKKNDKTRKT